MRKSVWPTAIAVIVILVLALGFYLVHRARRPKDPVTRLERLVQPLSLVLAKDAKGYQPARAAIVIGPRWAELKIHKGGCGHSGITGVDVELFFPPGSQKVYNVHQSFAETLNQSPELASAVFQHRDLRMRYVALGMARHQAVFGSSSYIRPALAPHVFDAMGTMVESGGDPLVSAEVCDILYRLKRFRLDVFRAAMDHPATHLKHSALRYARGLVGRLSVEQLRGILEPVVDHLDDRDGVTRGYCYQTLGPTVRELESELGGAKTPEGNAWPAKTIKLPPLPMRYVNIATMDWNEAVEVKKKWKAWLESLPPAETGRAPGQPAPESRVANGKAATPGAR
ncbi:MAG: hypothetical protein AMJ81_07840 [Phycisphaerae bacterium SM23_33]|jgi:hypothetical protein|nr:MAG: hypothetical protein AMJ81_07840 [Phycisphaerae bacterium SM23_33]